MPVHSLPPDAWLAPGFIDVQVNGGGDVLFNDVPTPEGISAIAAAHRRFGTTALLPTLISDTPDKMRAALAAAQSAAADNPSVLGIHFEGPFLSPEKPGVHDPSMFKRPDARRRRFAHVMARRRRGRHAGARSVFPKASSPTWHGRASASRLATPWPPTRRRRRRLPKVSPAFTHIFNAMRPLSSREPGPIAAALETPGVWFGMIVDGEHVAAPMLRLALRGAAHPMLVTDAMPSVGGSKSSFTLNGQEITVHDGRCTRGDGTLAGAALDMASAVRNSVRLLGCAADHRFALCVHRAGGVFGSRTQIGSYRPRLPGGHGRL